MSSSVLAETAGSKDNIGQLSESAGAQMGSVQLQAQTGQSRQLTPEEHYLFQQLHWRHWYGLHSVHNAQTGEVIESYMMDRDIHQAEPNGAKVVHNNTQHKASGKVCTGPWVFGPENSKPDGVCHPARDVLVSHNLPSGDSAWHPREVPDEPGKPFIVELFFPMPRNESRAAVLVAYERETYTAKSLLYAREDAWDKETKESSWSKSTQLLDERPSPGALLTGPEETITGNLVICEGAGRWKGFEQPVGEVLPGRQVPSSMYKLFHLPDGLSVYYPRQLERDAGSLHVSGHLVKKEGVHSMSVLFDANGHFDSLRSARYVVDTT